MAQSERELTLILRARNLGAQELAKFGGTIDKIASSATAASSRIGSAFTSLHSGITNGLGNLTENLASGAGLGDSMLAFGAFMAGQAAEGLIGGLLEKVAGSTIVAAIGAPLAAAGSSIGAFLAAAIPAGMALAPVLIVAAIGAAILFLVNNPEIAQKLLDVAAGLIKGIIDGLVGLGTALVGAFGAAVDLVIQALGLYIETIVGLWLSIPGRLVNLAVTLVGVIKVALDAVLAIVGPIVQAIVDVILAIPRAVGAALDAIGQLPKQVTTGGAFTVPGIPGQQFPGMVGPGHAGGGWVGLNGPEWGLYGERGPEYVIPHHDLIRPDAGGGVTLRGVSMDEIRRAVESGLLFQLRLAGTGQG